MKLSQLIKTLQAAQNRLGDVPVNLMDEEAGRWHPVAEVVKLHPYTGPHGCANRDEPANAVGLHRLGGSPSDLVIG
jgi:hypothetical protein